VRVRRLQAVEVAVRRVGRQAVLCKGGDVAGVIPLAEPGAARGWRQRGARRARVEVAFLV
jgi:hypothetical protein